VGRVAGSVGEQVEAGIRVLTRADVEAAWIHAASCYCAASAKLANFIRCVRIADETAGVELLLHVRAILKLSTTQVGSLEEAVAQALL
jgi:hypothetical protein